MGSAFNENVRFVDVLLFGVTIKPDWESSIQWIFELPFNDGMFLLLFQVSVSGGVLFIKVFFKNILK